MMQATKQERIYQLLKERIEREAYAPGSCLPKEVELAAELGIARKTLRPALEQLAMEGLIERIKGKGTFIRDKSAPRTKILALSNDSDISNPFHYIYPGVKIEADALNITVELCTPLSLLSQSTGESARRIRSCNFQGIIWFASNFNGDESLLTVLRATGLPVLLPHALRRDMNITGFHVMGTDFSKVNEDGLRYLAEKGFHRVAYLSSGNMRGVSVEEYFQTVRQIGLDEDRNLLYLTVSHLDKKSIQKGIDVLLSKIFPPPDALFCFSDFFAIHVYEYCRTKGIRIPDDIAILSIGGHIGCNFMNPTLSAIDFDNQEIGRNAVRLMQKIILDKHYPVSFTNCPFRLIERESTCKSKSHTAIL